VAEYARRRLDEIFFERRDRSLNKWMRSLWRRATMVEERLADLVLDFIHLFQPTQVKEHCPPRQTHPAPQERIVELARRRPRDLGGDEVTSEQYLSLCRNCSWTRRSEATGTGRDPESPNRRPTDWPSRFVDSWQVTSGCDRTSACASEGVLP
jgi:hypothetical protein